MKLFEITKDIEKGINEVSAVSRRDLLGKLGHTGVKLALASLPFAMSMMSGKKAKAQSGNLVIEALNFALTLEYLEYEFYRQGQASGIIAARYTDVFDQIRKHEQAHVALLVSAIRTAGGTPVGPLGPEAFDFTAGGTYSPFTDFGTFLTLSQAFEDTGVRAYKGQAGNLKSDGDTLTVALQIHAVEARHAAQVRRIRATEKVANAGGQKGWITLNQANGAPSAVYEGEQSTIQAGVNIAALLNGNTNAASEAFDEILSKEQVLTIANPFIVTG